MRLLAIVCLFLFGACSSRELANERYNVSYLEARELWDDVDRKALQQQRISSDGFLSPQSCVKTFMNEVFSAEHNRNFLADERFCARHFSEALRFQIATSKLQFERRIVKGNKNLSVGPINNKHAYDSGNKATILSC